MQRAKVPRKNTPKTRSGVPISVLENPIICLRERIFSFWACKVWYSLTTRVSKDHRMGIISAMTVSSRLPKCAIEFDISSKSSWGNNKSGIKEMAITSVLENADTRSPKISRSAVTNSQPQPSSMLELSPMEDQIIMAIEEFEYSQGKLIEIYRWQIRKKAHTGSSFSQKDRTFTDKFTRNIGHPNQNAAAEKNRVAWIPFLSTVVFQKRKSLPSQVLAQGRWV